MSRKKMDSALNLEDYTPPEKASGLAAKAAHFLDWAAKTGPGQYVPYTLAVKAINSYGRLPQANSDAVVTLRHNMTAIRRHLNRYYGRDLDSLAGVGMRATFSDADALLKSLPKKMKRFRAAKASLKATVDLIDPKALPNTPGMEPWKKWLTRGVSDVMRLISSSDFEAKLLPPANEDQV